MSDDHVSKQIRDCFESEIKTIPDFEKRVYPGRVYQLSPKELPAALIFTENEEIEKATRQHHQPGAPQKRFIETVVYTFTRSQDRILDSLDSLAQKIEQKIFEDPTLKDIAMQTYLSDRSNLIGGDPDSPTGASRLSFISIVLTKEGFPNQPIKNGGIFS